MAVNREIPKEVELMTLDALIEELKGRVGAMVIAYYKIPRVQDDGNGGDPRPAIGAGPPEHAAACLRSGPPELVQELFGLIRKASFV